MDDRKRSASEYDDGAILPAAKRQATVLMNGGDDQTAQDSDKIKFGVSNSPWQVDLATVQKDALFRQMKEYKREKQHLEQRLEDSEKRVETSDDRLIAIDGLLEQLIKELKVLVGDLKSPLVPTKNSSIDNGNTFVSRVLQADDEAIKTITDGRLQELKEAFGSLIAKVPHANPDITQLQNELSRMIASESVHIKNYEKTQASMGALKDLCDEYKYKWGLAKTQLGKAQSQACQYLEMQTRKQAGPPESVETKKPNGENNNGEIEQTSVAVDEEVSLARRAAEAEVQQRKEQVHQLEDELSKLNSQLTSTTTRLGSLTDDDYAKTDLFKSIKSQFEEVVSRVNDLQATNTQLRDEAKKLQAERTQYRIQMDEECRTNCTEMESKMARQEEDVQRLRAERDHAHMTRTTLETTQARHDESLSTLTALNEATEEKVKSLETEVSRLRIQLGEQQPTDESLSHLADQDADTIKNEYAKLHSSFKMLNQELSSMQTAATKFNAIASTKARAILQIEAELERLREVKNKSELVRFNEKQVLEKRMLETETMRKQASKSAEIIAQLKDSEYKCRELCTNLEKQVAEYQHQLSSLTDQTRSLTLQSTQSKEAADLLRSQVSELTKAIVAKDETIAATGRAQRDAEAEVASLRVKVVDAKKKVDEWRNKTRSDPTDEMEMLRKVAYCNTCNSNLKNTVIKNCGHILCDTCAKDRLSNRQRKCPVCMKAFGANDLMPVHLV